MTTLEYGRRVPAWRRRRVVWRLGIPLAIVVALLVGRAAWPRVDRWLAARRFERDARAWYAAACDWSQPASTLKWSNAEADADDAYRRALDALPPGAERHISGTNLWSPNAFATPIERGIVQTPAGDRAWSHADGPMPFLHARATPEGVRALVCMSVPAGGSPDKVDLLVSLYAPDDDGRIARLNAVWANVDLSSLGDADELRIFAGRPDPADAARFTIPFTSHGRPGVIDGVLESGTARSSDPAMAARERAAHAGVRLTIRRDATSVPTKH